NLHPSHSSYTFIFPRLTLAITIICLPYWEAKRGLIVAEVSSAIGEPAAAAPIVADAGVGSEVITEARPEIVAEARPEAVAEAAALAVVEAGPEAIAEATPEVVVESRPEVIAEAEPELEAEAGALVVADAGPEEAVAGADSTADADTAAGAVGSVASGADDQICAWVVEAMDRCQRQKRRRDLDTIIRFTLNKHSVGAETVRQAIRRMEERGIIIGVPIADYVSYRMTAKSPACGGIASPAPAGGVAGVGVAVGSGGLSADRRKRRRSGPDGAPTPPVKRPLAPVFPKLEPGDPMRMPLMPHGHHHHQHHHAAALAAAAAGRPVVLPATAVVVSKSGQIPLASLQSHSQQRQQHQVPTAIAPAPPQQQPPLQATTQIVHAAFSTQQIHQQATAQHQQQQQPVFVTAKLSMDGSHMIVGDIAAEAVASRTAAAGQLNGACEAAAAPVVDAPADGQATNGGGCSDGAGVEETPSVLDWTVEEVRDWLKCEGYPAEADCFLNEQVDGISLMLIRRMDLLTKVGIRLGPAIKIFAKICDLQTRVSTLS
ncbi:hypothetical protein BOX15_Mlig012296g1, partial [Macrostomum lignano]